MRTPTDRAPPAGAGFASLADVLRHRAAVQPDDRAYVVLSDRGGEEASVTFAELARRAGELARRIARDAPTAPTLTRPGFYLRRPARSPLKFTDRSTK